MDNKLIFTINCGSTSTKLALFENAKCVASESLHIPPEQIAGMLDIFEQLPLRRRSIEEFIAKNGIDMSKVDMIASRGGPTPMCRGGAYAVNQLMVDVLRAYKGSPHASMLCAPLGRELSDRYGIPHIIYDSVMANEFDDAALYTGLPGLYNTTAGHVLNARAVAHAVAERLGEKYENCRFVVAHCGGGTSVTAHRGGRIVDGTSDVMTPERVGKVQPFQLLPHCFSGEYTFATLSKTLLGRGGFVAWLGTSDAREAAERAQSGDAKAALAFRIMAHQLARAIGEMAAVLDGRVDRVIFTGGLANSALLMELTMPKVAFIAPIELVPGELENEALAAGALRVLRGEETAKEYDILPSGFKTAEEFYKSIS